MSGTMFVIALSSGLAWGIVAARKKLSAWQPWAGALLISAAMQLGLLHG